MMPRKKLPNVLLASNRNQSIRNDEYNSQSNIYPTNPEHEDLNLENSLVNQPETSMQMT